MIENVQNVVVRLCIWMRQVHFSQRFCPKKRKVFINKENFLVHRVNVNTITLAQSIASGCRLLLVAVG